MSKVLPLLFAFFAVPLLAEDWVKKDPEVQARKNLESAKCMKEEAAFMGSAALKLEAKEAKVVKDYAEATASEAEWLEKSAEAYSKKQLRLADRADRKAAEYCEKRGKMMGAIDKLRPKLNAEKKAEKKAEKNEGEEPSDSQRLEEIERKQAALKAEKKKLLEQNSH